MRRNKINKANAKETKEADSGGDERNNGPNLKNHDDKQRNETANLLATPVKKKINDRIGQRRCHQLPCWV